MKTDIALSCCKCVEKQSGNVHFTWHAIADKLTMLKKVYLGHRALHVLQKYFGAFQ